jgi:hypothetical protein
VRARRPQEFLAAIARLDNARERAPWADPEEPEPRPEPPAEDGDQSPLADQATRRRVAKPKPARTPKKPAPSGRIKVNPTPSNPSNPVAQSTATPVHHRTVRANNRPDLSNPSGLPAPAHPAESNPVQVNPAQSDPSNPSGDSLSPSHPSERAALPNLLP